MTPTIRESRRTFFFSCSRDRHEIAPPLRPWGPGIGQIKSVGGTITSRLDGNNTRGGRLSLALQRIRISFEFSFSIGSKLGSLPEINVQRRMMRNYVDSSGTKIRRHTLIKNELYYINSADIIFYFKYFKFLL